MRCRLTISTIFTSILALTACEQEREAMPPAVPVRTEVAKRASFTPSLTLLGVVRAAQSIPLAAQQRGAIRRFVEVDRVGVVFVEGVADYHAEKIAIGGRAGRGGSALSVGARAPGPENGSDKGPGEHNLERGGAAMS